MRRTRWNALAFLFIGALVLAACDAGATPTPEAPDDGTPPPDATEEPATGFADSITYELDAQVGLMSNAASDVPTARLTAYLYDALYRYNAELEPVPQLGECDASEDGLEYTCTVTENAFFHNGDPITADDVAYTFQLSISENCTYNPSICFGDFIDSVEAVDDSTVVFTLPDVYGPFYTEILVGPGVESRSVIEAAFEDFTGGAPGADEIRAAQAALDDALAPEEPDADACEAALADAEAIVAEADIEDAPAREDYEDEDGTFDACGYAGDLSVLLGNLADAVEGEGVDAVAAVYSLLSFNRDPIGSGPYELAEFSPGESVAMTAFADYYQGAPATQTINWPIYTDKAVAANDLAAGNLDVVWDLTPDARAVVEGDDNLKQAVYNDFGHFELQYNMHEAITLADGTEWQGWFFDKALRKAMQYCIDKAELVDIATDGNGVPIEADIPPASWAFNTDLVPVERDVDRARQFIEDEATVHTWTEGDDGIYVNQDGDPLSAHVLVRAGQQDRIDFMDLLADQVRDCGIEIEVEAADFQTVLIPSLSWPHIPPGQSEPWHAYFGGWGVTPEPNPFSLFHGSQCSSEETPSTFNYPCFQNDEADALIDAGLRTSDIDERTEIYREYQEILQEEQPYLFGWSNINADAMVVGLQYTDGELELDSPNWGWERHKIVLVENGG